jgi:hypothetical protein
VSVITPHRPPETDERSLEERVAELEALIEEARQRARSRRRRRGAYLVLAVLAGGGLYFGVGHSGGGTAAAPAARPSGGAALAAARTTARWSAAHGPDRGPVDAVAVAPSAPRVVYLGAYAGVCRSTDGGRNWVSA